VHELVELQLRYSYVVLKYRVQSFFFLFTSDMFCLLEMGILDEA